MKNIKYIENQVTCNNASPSLTLPLRMQGPSPLPTKFKMANEEKFDGSGSPIAYVEYYSRAMHTKGAT